MCTGYLCEPRCTAISDVNLSVSHSQCASVYDALQRIADPILLAKNLRIMTNHEMWVSIHSPQRDEADGKRPRLVLVMLVYQAGD
jgi:hypothetical protein